MKKMLMTWSEIDSWLACTKDKMLKNCVAKVLKLFQRQPKFGRTLICLIYSLVKSINRCYYFKITSRLWSHAPNKNNIPSYKNHFQDFPSKEKKMLHYAFGHAFGLVILCFVMLLLTQSTPNTRILGSTTHSPRFYNYSLHQQFVKEFINKKVKKTLLV